MSNVNDKFGQSFFGGRLNIQTEIVNGVCPTCNHSGVLVSLFKQHYRCITCGSDLEQKVNGVISYIPVENLKTKIVLGDSHGQEKA
jgi:transposase-like protein